MLKDIEMMTLAKLGGGAAVELFDREFQKVVENIVNPNTPAETTREITLTVKMKPSKDREFSQTDISVKSKMASPNGFQTTIFTIEEKDGSITTYEHNPYQTRLNFDSRPENVVDMPQKEAQGD